MRPVFKSKPAPDFKLMHDRMFSDMDDIVRYTPKTAERGQFLMYTQGPMAILRSPPPSPVRGVPCLSECRPSGDVVTVERRSGKRDNVGLHIVYEGVCYLLARGIHIVSGHGEE